jgi:hypothetical protein
MEEGKISVELDCGPGIVSLSALLLCYPVIFYLDPKSTSNCLGGIPLKLYRAFVSNTLDEDGKNPPQRHARMLTPPTLMCRTKQSSLP